MNFTNENSLSNWKEKTIKKVVYYYREENVEKITIQIKFTSGYQIIYSDDRGILRIVQVDRVLENPQIFNNMNQIEYLSWQSYYSQNKKNICKWIVSWDQRVLKNVGGYYSVGKKQGLWVDLFLNFWNQERVFEIGEYYNGLRIGKWNFFKDGQKIGGGFYSIDGQKQGKWIELDQGFYFRKQVKYNGEYNQNGKKVGRWDILYKQNTEPFKLMVQWWWNIIKKEINKRLESGQNYMKGLIFMLKSLIMVDGIVCFIYEINRNINKFKYDLIKEYYICLFSGGGVYNQEGEQRKFGKWTELDEDFKETHFGVYNQEGMKVGRWDIMQYDSGKQEYKIIGGGSYDLKGNQKKIGNWVEFHNEKQIFFIGENNMKGIKVGRWDIKQWFWRAQKYIQIGGGSYDKEENQIKIGNWVEFDEEFHDKKQVISHGEYNKNGLKVG